MASNDPPEVTIGLTLKQAEYLEAMMTNTQGQGLALLNMLHQRSQRETLSAKSAEHLRLLVEQSEIVGGIMEATRKGISEK